MAKFFVRMVLVAMVAVTLQACSAGKMDPISFGGDAPGDIKN